MLNTKLKKESCLYCTSLFQPKRRWIQKYCCESCRTMACRERKKGVSGVIQNKAKSLSVSDLYHIHEMQFSETNEYNKVSNLWMQEILRTVNQVKHDQNPELVKDLQRKISDWDSKGMARVPELVREMKLSQLKQELQTGLILKNQNTQQLLTVVSGLFGPIIGKKIWDSVEGLISEKKEIPLEEKIDSIMKIVSNLSAIK